MRKLRCWRSDQSTLTTPAGYTTGYDHLDETTTVITDPLGRIITVTFDEHRNVVDIEEPAAGQSGYVWHNGRPVAAVDPAGERTTVIYSDELPSGTRNMQAVQYPDDTRYTFVYDEAGRLSEGVNALGQVTTFLWDEAGNREAVVDPAGGRWTWTYNAAGQVTSTTNPLGEITTTIHDAATRPVAVQNALGVN